MDDRLSPGRGQDLAAVVVLHGRGFDHTSAFSSAGLGLDRFLAHAVSQGVPPFALASIDGGDTYWHARDSGEDSGTMVTEEFLPLLSAQGLDITRIAFFGWSMGGYGALSLAERLGPERVAAAGALSPALWEDYSDTAPGAFDDAADFEENNVFGREGDLAQIKLRIDCGEGDPFYAAAKAYRSGFDTMPDGGFQRGDHDLGYWRRMAPRQLAFLGNALSG